jgi:hypothetical protein
MGGEREGAAMKRSEEVREEGPYISPKELARRWLCSRSSVDRIARRAGLKRLCLGEGRNGIVRFLREEVEAYEASRCV